MPLSRITSPFQSATANVYSPSANTIALRTSSADRVVLNSSGNIGMGSAGTTAAADIHINDTMSSNTAYHTAMILQAQAATGPTGNSTVGGVQLEFRGRTDGAIANSTLATIGAFVHTNAVNNQGGIRLRSQQTGGTLGDLVAFTNSNDGSARIHLRGSNMSASGTGIAFPSSQIASSDPNTLDDYEEGSWTSTINYSTVTTTGGTNGSVTRTGFYIKVGNIVHISLHTGNMKDVASTFVFVNFTLPFTAQSSGPSTYFAVGHYGCVGHYAGQLAGGGFFQAYTSPATNVATTRYTEYGGGAGWIATGGLAYNDAHISGTYMAS